MKTEKQGRPADHTKRWFLRKASPAQQGPQRFALLLLPYIRVQSFCPPAFESQAPPLSRENILCMYGTSLCILLLSKENLWATPRTEREVRKLVFLLLPWGRRTPKMRNSSNIGGMLKMCDIDRKHDKLPLQLDLVTNENV